MKKRLSPQEKKPLAYDRDHYVSAGESRHAFRKNWPKKKAMMNQKHRHRVAQALHKMEKIGDVASIEGPIEDSAEQLKKTHPQDKLFKVGIKSLKEYVQEGQESRESRAQRSIREREYIDARYKELISSFEHNYKSPKGRELLFAIRANDFSLRLFLKRNPEWRPRLKAKLVELERATKKVEGEQERKQLEKERTKELHKAIHKQLKKEGLV